LIRGDLPQLLPDAGQLLLFANHAQRTADGGRGDHVADRTDLVSIHWPRAATAAPPATGGSDRRAGGTADAGAVPALSTDPGAAVGPARRCPCRPQRLVRQHVPRQYLATGAVGRDRIPRQIYRPGATQVQVVLAWRGARQL